MLECVSPAWYKHAVHKVTIAAGHNLEVRCSACKQFVAVESNPGRNPKTLAFNHPRQSIKTKCPSCQTELTWEPGEAKHVLAGLTK